MSDAVESATEVVEDAATLREQLAASEAAVTSGRDQYLRALAELDNVRKRAERDVQNAHRYALERFAGELLEVRDTLELAVESAATADARALADGQEAVLRLLAKAFEKFAIVRIDPAGEPFNPEYHEAVMMQEAPDAAPGSVLQVIRCGYCLNDRLLRPARVVVAKTPGS